MGRMRGWADNFGNFLRRKMEWNFNWCLLNYFLNVGSILNTEPSEACFSNFYKLQVIQYCYTLLYNNLLYNIVYLYWKRENEKILKYYTYWISLKKKKRKNWSYLPSIDNYPKVIFDSWKERGTAIRREISSVKPCPTFISRWFISRRATTKSNRGARRFFPSLGFFLVFADRGNWSAILFLSFFLLFSFFFLSRDTISYDLQEGGMNRYESGTMERWSGEFFLRPAFHPSFAAAVSRAMGKSDRIAR